MTLQETLAKLNWGGEGYAEYQGYSYLTGPEKTAWNQLGYELSNMNNWMNLQFKEQQGLLNNFLIPQLESFVNNPPGFGAQALAGMRSTLIGNIGSQLTSQIRGQQNAFASQNIAGLGSGVEQGIIANLKQGAAGEEASGLNQIAIANAQEQVQQREFGLSGLSQAEQELGQLPQSAQLAASLTGLEQQTAKGFYGQQSPLSGILGSLAGTVLGIGGGLIGGPAGAQIGADIGGALAGGRGTGPGTNFIASNWQNLGLPSIWGGGGGPTATGEFGAAIA